MACGFSAAKGKKKATKRGKASEEASSSNGSTNLSDFKVENAKSGRAECLGCNQKIPKVRRLPKLP